MEPLSGGLNTAGMTCRSHSETAIASVEENLVRLLETTYWVLTAGSIKKVLLKPTMIRGKKGPKRQG